MKPILLLPFLAMPLQAVAAPSDVQAVVDAARAKGEAVAKVRAAHLGAGKPSGEFKADCGPEIAAATARLAGEKQPETRRALLVARLYYRRLARETPAPGELKEARQEVSATDPAWALDPGLLAAAADWDPRAFGAYPAQARAEHPDGALRRHLLLSHFTDMIDTGAEKDWRPSYALLQKDFPGSAEAGKAEERLASETATALGAPAPPFDLASLGDPAQRFTPASFRGKFVLIDFWASWCPDCVREMPNLHRAFARFHGQGLEILSLSLDRRAEHIAPYRAHSATPMPWKHAFLEGGWKHPVVGAYGVKSIPKAVLLGPDGRVVASGAQLRGDNLDRTLESLLAPR